MAATYLAIVLLFARSYRTGHTGLSLCTDRELHSHGRDCNISADARLIYASISHETLDTRVVISLTHSTLSI